MKAPRSLRHPPASAAVPPVPPALPATSALPATPSPSLALAACALLALLVLTTAGVLAACVSASPHGSTTTLDANQESSAPVAGEAAGQADGTTEKNSPLLIGVPEEGAVTFELTNETGQDIVGLQAKETIGAEYGSQLLAPGEIWGADRRALISAGIAAVQQSTAPDAADVLIKPLYDLRLQTASGTVYELYAIYPQTLVEARIRIEEDVAYLVYREGDAEASTLEAQRARHS